MKIIWIDTETTGVDFVKNGITQIAALMEIDGEIVEEFEVKIKPFAECEITEEALKITGQTREMIASFTPERVAYDAFVSFLDRHISKFDKTDKATFAGYNVGFDDQMVRSLSARRGDKYLGSYRHNGCIDVMSFAAYHLGDKRSKMENFKLISVAKEILGDEYVNGLNFHDAMTDIRVTRDIFKELVK